MAPLPFRAALLQAAFGALLALGLAASAEDADVLSQSSVRDVSVTPRAAITRTDLSLAEWNAPLEFEVVLKMRNLGEVQSRVRARQRIGRAEMAQKYHPLPKDYDSVVAWLKAKGFTITREDSSRLAVFASGSVAQVSRIFQAGFGRVALDGREHTSAISAPALPAALSSVVLGVNGLQPHLRPQKHSREVVAEKNAAGGSGPPFYPRDILTAYGAAGVTATGAGQTIGIVIDTFPLDSDLTTFWSNCGVNQSLARIEKVPVVTSTLGAPEGEETLDVEWSSAMAPDARIRIYATGDLSFTHLDAAYAQLYADVPTHPSLHQVSMSYGLGEAYLSASQMDTDEQYFANLASAGVTIFVSSGDGGSNPTTTGGSGATTATPEAPSNSPSVTSVGGTSLYTDFATGQETSESAWSGSGGGVSAHFSRPAWQVGNGLPAGSGRAGPDVAAPADPNTGAYVLLNGGVAQYGGTSWSAPVWAGFAARINEARAVNGMGSMGLLGPRVYPLLGTGAFRDIVGGSNGSYTAGSGYDLCTGLGAPNLTALVQVLSNAPNLTTQPVAQALKSGNGAAYTVSANGAAPFTWRWQRMAAGAAGWNDLADSETYSGVVTPTLALSTVTAAMSGDQFRCIVTNSYGSATSEIAPLLVDVPYAPLVITTFAGNSGTFGSANGTGTAATFYYPGGAAIDASGNLIIADTNNHLIRKVTPAGVVTTLAGTAGVAGKTSSGTGQFNNPSNVAVDSSGNVYVADASNSTIRKITASGTVSTLAGRAGSTGTTNGNKSSARFYVPLGLAVDKSGNVYVADSYNNLIRKINPAGDVTTLAGNGSSSGFADGTGGSATFNYPTDVAVDAAGNVYVADYNNHTIRKITSAGVVTTLAGKAGVSGSTDGLVQNARFNAPSGVRLDAAGNVYVADTNNQTIRLISTSGFVTTIAGALGQSGSSDGIGSAAKFNFMAQAAPDSNGNIYIVDTYNHTLRKGVPAAAPAILSAGVRSFATAGQAATFSITASGNPAPTFQWQRLPVGGTAWTNLADSSPYAGVTTGTLAVTGVTSEMNGDQFQCVITNSIGSTVISSPLLLSVGIAPSVSAVNSVTFAPGLAGSFTVNASGSPRPTLSATGLPTWASLNPATGVISGTPPDTTGAPFSVTVTADNGFTPVATQQFLLQVRATAASWQTAHFGANAATVPAAALTADPDGDGIPNLLEYARGSDPMVQNSASPAAVSTDATQSLVLTATLDATVTDVTVAAEVSSDLITWKSGAGITEILSDTSSGAVRTVVYRDLTPVSDAAPRYIRLRATKP